MVTTGKTIDRVSETNWLIYVLELEGSRYYIGISIDVESRFQQHKTQGKNSAGWCKKHKPIQIIEIVNTHTKRMKEATLLEDIITLRYIEKYGASSVRGGRYTGGENAIVRSSRRHISNGSISILHTLVLDYKIKINELEELMIYDFVNQFSNKDEIETLLKIAKTNHKSKFQILKEIHSLAKTKTSRFQPICTL
ncbi:GIY-YIG nuclease family protein [Marinifilum sp.]|uniref:GIY-YIG nuclease family protein n=1 Tax=Marinifilum sp. TaxID=2033137 RepID=UPI003BA898C5